MNYILIVVFIFFKVNVFAQDNSPMKTIDSINLIESLNNVGVVHCAKENEKYHRKREGFTGIVNCRVKCLGEEARKTSIENTFTNEAMKLETGDGGLYASFNIKLDLWVESICLKSAINECRSINKIEMVNFNGLKSGDWIYEGPIYCPTVEEARFINNDHTKRAKILPGFKQRYGPFLKESGAILSTKESRFKLDTLDLPSGGFNVIDEQSKVDPDRLIEMYAMSEEFMTSNEEFFNSPDITMDSIKSYVLKTTGHKTIQEFTEWRIKQLDISVKECKKSIAVQTCYGDCIPNSRSNSFPVKMIMASNVISESNVDEKVVCIDEFINFIKKRKVPKSLFNNYCRLYLNQSFFENRFTGTSCSAFRYTDPCDQIKISDLYR